MKLRITVEGRTYDVDVEVVPEAPAAAAAPARADGRPPAPPSLAPAPVRAAEARHCVAPLPGTVIRIAVKPGDEVALNQTLLVLDAMKMETNIPSPVAGRVRSVAVPPGARVQQGDVLVEFE